MGRHSGRGPRLRSVCGTGDAGPESRLVCCDASRCRPRACRVDARYQRGAGQVARPPGTVARGRSRVPAGRPAARGGHENVRHLAAPSQALAGSRSWPVPASPLHRRGGRADLGAVPACGCGSAHRTRRHARPAPVARLVSVPIHPHCDPRDRGCAGSAVIRPDSQLLRQQRKGRGRCGARGRPVARVTRGGRCSVERVRHGPRQAGAERRPARHRLHDARPRCASGRGLALAGLR